MDKKKLTAKLSKCEDHLIEARKNLNRLYKNAKESRLLLQETLSVKLRYEEIIKNILMNEKEGAEKLTVR